VRRQPAPVTTGDRTYLRTPVLAAVVALLLIPAGAAAQEPPPEPVIPPGAKAAGLDLGGMTLSQAAAHLDATFAAAMAQPVELRVAGHRSTLKLRSIDFVFDPLKTAKRAYSAATSTPPAPDGTYPVDVALHVTYDGDKLAAFIARVDNGSRVRPRNARLRITVRRMILRRAVMGWSLDEKALALALDPLLADPHAVRILRVERERVPPKVNANDLRRQHRTVLTIDRAHFKLRYFRNLKWRRTYGIAVGAPGYETPTGRFAIHNKAVNPAWSAPDEPWAGAYRNEVVEGGSPENPLKARWMGIVGGVGIHGTADEASIGTAASHGCIRMRVADVIRLYPKVPIGTAVLIR
jgi:lipoprotein-anchoring transpeptidase ErfK/SrfK